MRQVIVPGVGARGQAKLAQARVLVVGAGGLGSPAAIYLAAAGVGTLGIVDDDVVDVTNLHRQPLHMTEAVGRPKVESAAAHLHALNPDVTVVTHRERLGADGALDRALDLVSGYDVVVDGADNFETRYVISDACTQAGIPHVWAAVLTTGGQLSVFVPGGPTYRDLYPRPATDVPSCAQAGVLGVVPGLLGVAQAAEVLKLILGMGTPLAGQVGVYDLLTGTWEYVPLVARGVRGAAAGRGMAAGRGEGAAEGTTTSAMDVMEVVASITPARLAALPGALVLDVRERDEYDAGHISGATLLPLSSILDDPVATARAVGKAAGGAAAEGAGSGAGAREVYVVCHAGVRSQNAIDIFTAVNHPSMNDVRLVNVIGGMAAWEAAALPTVTEP